MFALLSSFVPMSVAQLSKHRSHSAMWKFPREVYGRKSTLRMLYSTTWRRGGFIFLFTDIFILPTRCHHPGGWHCFGTILCATFTKGTPPFPVIEVYTMFGCPIIRGVRFAFCGDFHRMMTMNKRISSGCFSANETSYQRKHWTRPAFHRLQSVSLLQIHLQTSRTRNIFFFASHWSTPSL